MAGLGMGYNFKRMEPIIAAIMINKLIIATPHLTNKKAKLPIKATRLSLCSKVYQSNETRGFPSPDSSGFGFFLGR